MNIMTYKIQWNIVFMAADNFQKVQLKKNLNKIVQLKEYFNNTAKNK